MLRAIGIVLFVILCLMVVFIGVEFAAVNLEPVTIDYFLGSATWPLAGVLVGAFAVGFVVTAILGLVVIWPLRWRVARLRRVVSEQQHEIGALRQNAGPGAHAA